MTRSTLSVKEEVREVKVSGPAPLIVVDVQNGFVNDNSRHVLPAIQQLLTVWVEKGWPVFMTRFLNPPDSQWERLIGWSRLRTSPEIDLHPALHAFTPHAIVVEKVSYTSLTGEVATAFAEQSWNTAVLCGIATDGCVLKTAVDLFEYPERSITPIVVRDACASHAGASIHQAGLTLLERFIGRSQVVDCSTLLSPTHASSA